MEKLFIKNRKGQNMCVVVEKADIQKGLAFVMHGLSGNKDQTHIVTFASAFQEKMFTVVRFDTTNTFGDSDGNYEDATITNYYEDLEDVITWAKIQEWYEEPFALAGHSLGGICTALYAERHPSEVRGLAPTSTVVSGALTLESHRLHDPEEVVVWERDGFIEAESSTRPGLIKRLKWSHMLDRLKYDLLPEASKLTMPVLLIVGSEDWGTSPEHHKMLYEKLPGPKEMHIIEGAPHTFTDSKHLAEIKDIFLKWIDSL